MRMTGHWKHHMGCGCPACTGIEHKKKMLFAAMIFFMMMAIFNAMIAGAIHLIIHAKELCAKE
jgi:hypothetical protein